MTSNHLRLDGLLKKFLKIHKEFKRVTDRQVHENGIRKLFPISNTPTKDAIQTRLENIQSQPKDSIRWCCCTRCYWFPNKADLRYNPRSPCLGSKRFQNNFELYSLRSLSYGKTTQNRNMRSITRATPMAKKYSNSRKTKDCSNHYPPDRFTPQRVN